MSRILGPSDVVYGSFPISGATGIGANADATPTVSVWKNNVVDGAVTVTLTNPSTGLYLYTFTIPSGYAVGDWVRVQVVATVGAILLPPTEVDSFRLSSSIASRASQASLDVVDDLLDTEVAAIKAKTDLIPSDPADASDIASRFNTLDAAILVIDDFLDTEIAAVKAKTDLIPADPADASDIAARFSTVDAALVVIDDFLDTEVAAIKAKTDLIPTDPADASDIAARFSTLDAAILVIDDFLDTEVAAIKAKTDLIPTDPADASDIAARFSTLDAAILVIDDLLDTEVPALTTAVGLARDYAQIASVNTQA